MNFVSLCLSMMGPSDLSCWLVVVSSFITPVMLVRSVLKPPLHSQYWQFVSSYSLAWCNWRFIYFMFFPKNMFRI